MRRDSKRIAILGAGAIGLEAAHYARALGHVPIVYERGEVGENIRRWGFVRLFSPWSLNVSTLGLGVLEKRGIPAPSSDAFPTGKELVEQYLLPLAEDLGDSVKTGVEVLGVSKVGLLKGENIGGRRRASAPFRILLGEATGESEVTSNVVLDACGVYSSPCALGDGGVPAVGESAARDRIDYHLVDVLGAAREDFAKKSVLLVGAGFSAATSLVALVRLLEEEPSTRLYWARRSTGPDPFRVLSPDPLPDRARLATAGNRVAAEPPHGCQPLSGVSVTSVLRVNDRLEVEFRPVEGGGAPETIVVDRILANVGYRPDPVCTRELQIHQCYATEGPMKLAAELLGRGGGGDCLAQTAGAADSLKNPEGGFFVLGHKSYGRRSDFLLRTGREQVRDVFRLIENDANLDLYEGRAE